MIFTLNIILFILITSSLISRVTSNGNGDPESIIMKRNELLLQIGRSVERPPCHEHIFIVVEDYPYGRSGNNMLELVHGLWIAETLNATLRLPGFMRTIINPLHHAEIAQYFCARSQVSARSRAALNIRAVDLLNVWRMFKEDRFKSRFPKLTKEVVEHAASIYLRLMSMLWSKPNDDILSAGLWIVKNKLGNSLKYTTVHKRYMEGECPDIFRRMSNISDFSATELPMDHPSWKQLSNTSHPLCSMDLDFVRGIQKLSHREDQPLYLAYDGYGSINDYRKVHAVTASDLDSHTFPMFLNNPKCTDPRKCTENSKFLDMFLAIHGDFFILNPRSTYSWYVYVIRAALGLPSVPTIINRDLLFYSDEEYELYFDGKRWVGQMDIQEARSKLEGILNHSLKVD